MTQRKRSFILVLTLFLLTLLISTGSTLSVGALVETIACTRLAATLEHELALQSFVNVLPKLWRSRLERRTGQPSVTRLELSVGRCAVRCDVRPERTKLNLHKITDLNATTQRLKDLARANGLPVEQVRLRPHRNKADEPNATALAWFDQIVQPSGFEEVFHWRLLATDEDESARPKSWSDLVTFWDSTSGEALALEIETRIEDDVRHWYVVVALEGGRARILHRSSIP
jgi:hypothetical protein